MTPVEAAEVILQGDAWYPCPKCSGTTLLPLAGGGLVQGESVAFPVGYGGGASPGGPGGSSNLQAGVGGSVFSGQSSVVGYGGGAFAAGGGGGGAGPSGSTQVGHGGSGGTPGTGGRTSIGFQRCKECETGFFLKERYREACLVLGKELPEKPGHRGHDGGVMLTIEI